MVKPVTDLGGVDIVSVERYGHPKNLVGRVVIDSKSRGERFEFRFDIEDLMRVLTLAKERSPYNTPIV